MNWEIVIEIDKVPGNKKKEKMGQMEIDLGKGIDFQQKTL